MPAAMKSYSVFTRRVQTLAKQNQSILRARQEAIRLRNYATQPKRASKPLDISPVFTKAVMAPVGPYSQAIKTSTTIYCSGQLPADSEGNLVQGSMEEKTRACLRALSAILEEAGSSLDRVVKVQIFLTNMDDFPEMNKEYTSWIKHAPARSCIAVAGLPKGADIEIECVAIPGVA